MTGEIPSRYGMESRPSRSNIHLLHQTKTDEIEVLESGSVNNHNNIRNGIANSARPKVSVFRVWNYSPAMDIVLHCVPFNGFVHSFASVSAERKAKVAEFICDTVWPFKPLRVRYFLCRELIQQKCIQRLLFMLFSGGLHSMLSCEFHLRHAHANCYSTLFFVYTHFVCQFHLGGAFFALFMSVIHLRDALNPVHIIYSHNKISNEKKWMAVIYQLHWFTISFRFVSCHNEKRRAFDAHKRNDVAKCIFPISFIHAIYGSEGFPLEKCTSAKTTDRIAPIYNLVYYNFIIDVRHFGMCTLSGNKFLANNPVAVL